MDWIDLAQKRVRWRAVVKTVMNLELQPSKVKVKIPNRNKTSSFYKKKHQKGNAYFSEHPVTLNHSKTLH